MLPQLGIGYGRVPKAANSMIKRHLARAAGIEGVFGDEAFSQDRHWRTKAPHAYFLTAAGARRRFPGIFLFSFVREPLSRLTSCYRSKILRPDRVSDSLRREGLQKTTSFPDFVAHVCRRSDWRSNIHYRAQSHILRGKGGLAPDFIGRIEYLAEDWMRLSEIMAGRSLEPLPPPPGRKSLAREARLQTGELFQGEREMISMARRRYARDIALFYPEVSTVDAPGVQ